MAMNTRRQGLLGAILETGYHRHGNYESCLFCLFNFSKIGVVSKYKLIIFNAMHMQILVVAVTLFNEWIES